MGSPRNYKQINQYVGERVEVEFRDGRLLIGTLSFYNWEQQVIHISDYELMRPESDDEKYSKTAGRVMVVNCRDWKTVQIK